MTAAASGEGGPFKATEVIATKPSASQMALLPITDFSSQMPNLGTEKLVEENAPRASLENNFIRKAKSLKGGSYISLIITAGKAATSHKALTAQSGTKQEV